MSKAFKLLAVLLCTVLMMVGCGNVKVIDTPVAEETQEMFSKAKYLLIGNSDFFPQGNWEKFENTSLSLSNIKQREDVKVPCCYNYINNVIYIDEDLFQKGTKDQQLIWLIHELAHAVTVTQPVLDSGFHEPIACFFTDWVSAKNNLPVSTSYMDETQLMYFIDAIFGFKTVLNLSWTGQLKSFFPQNGITVDICGKVDKMTDGNVNEKDLFEIYNALILCALEREKISDPEYINLSLECLKEQVPSEYIELVKNANLLMEKTSNMVENE